MTAFSFSFFASVSFALVFYGMAQGTLQPWTAIPLWLVSIFLVGAMLRAIANQDD